jgi:hypothetical protein
VSEPRRIATGAAFATLALLVALGIRPVSREQILAAYVLTLAAVGLAALTRVLRSASELPPPSQLEHALRPQPEEPMRPPELIRTEREIRLGTSSAWYLHTRLAPILREAAAARGVDFERRPDVARALLGDDVWELLRPDRPEPADRSAPGIPLARLRATVDVLERL